MGSETAGMECFYVYIEANTIHFISTSTPSMTKNVYSAIKKEAGGNKIVVHFDSPRHNFLHDLGFITLGTWINTVMAL